MTAKYHPTGDRFLRREYTKNGEHRRFKVDHAVSEMVRDHIALPGIGVGQVIFPVRLFASTEAARLAERPAEYLGADVWRPIWNAAVDEAGLPFRYTPYQVRHTHASWLIDQGVDLARVQYRLGHGDLEATTRYVKILDEEDPKAADVISAILGDVA